MDGMGAADVFDAGLGETNKSHLPLSDQITDRTCHVLHRQGSPVKKHRRLASSSESQFVSELWVGRCTQAIIETHGV
jgi:hypothetical protein